MVLLWKENGPLIASPRWLLITLLQLAPVAGALGMETGGLRVSPPLSCPSLFPGRPHGMAWHGIAWYGTVWHGTARLCSQLCPAPPELSRLYRGAGHRKRRG